MKAYLITTGTVFALITLAHFWRISLEGSQLAKNLLFVVLAVATAGLSIWAWRLLKRAG